MELNIIMYNYNYMAASILYLSISIALDRTPRKGFIFLILAYVRFLFSMAGVQFSSMSSMLFVPERD